MPSPKRLLLLHKKGFCYDSNVYFEECISREFAQLGWEITHVTCHKDSLPGCLKQFYGQHFDIILGLSSLIPKAKDETGAYCLDQIDGPVWHYILDHPLYHRDALCAQLSDFHILCMDETHAAFIEKYHPQVKEAVCFPLASSSAAISYPYQERSIEVLFTGTYTNPDDLLPDILKMHPDKVTLFQRTVATLLENDTMPLEEAVLMHASTDDLPLLLQQNYLIDLYMHSILREELLSQVVAGGIPLTLYGGDWEMFEEKCHQRIPGCEGLIDVRGEVPYDQLLGIYADSKIVLNQLPWFKAGLHDRIPMAMLNGALCLSDASDYLRARLTEGELIAYYELSDMSEAPKQLRYYLDHPAEAEAIALRAQKYAQENFTWARWVRDFIKLTGN